MTEPAADMSKDATGEAEKAEEVTGGEQVVQADVHQEPEDTQEPEDYPLDAEDDEDDEEEDEEEDLDEDLQDPDYEATEEGASVAGSLRVKVHIFQAGNHTPPSG